MFVKKAFTKFVALTIYFVCLAGLLQAQETIDRTVLPIQEPERPTFSELDVRNVEEKPPLFAV